MKVLLEKNFWTKFSEAISGGILEAILEIPMEEFLEVFILESSERTLEDISKKIF